MRAILGLTLVLVLTGCGSSSHDYGSNNSPAGNDGGQGGEQGGTGGGGVGPTEPGVINFAAVSAAFQRNKCMNCHSARGGNRAGINLETFENAKGFGPSIRMTVDDGSMPMGGPPVNSADQAIIDAWVVSGMPL